MSADVGTQPLNWRKPRRSIGNGECVEVAVAEGKIVVRDSKDPDGGWLAYPARSWQFFLEAWK